MTVSVSFWITFIVLIVGDVKTVPRSGPYELQPNRLDVCDDVGTDEVHFGGKMSSKGNGVLIYTNDVVFKVPWDDKLKADVEVQQLNNGVYTPKFVTQSFKNCEKMLKYGKDMWRSFFGAAGYNFTKCPLPADTYSVKDWKIDIRFNQLPTFIYGSYKLIVSFSKDKKRVGCFKVFGDVVPKTS